MLLSVIVLPLEMLILTINM